MAQSKRFYFLALLLIVALQASVPATAGATAHLTWETVSLKITQDEVLPHQTFVTTAGNVTCNEFHATSSLSGTSAGEIPVGDASYQQSGMATCQGPYGTTPKIEMNGCSYLLIPEETLGSPESVTGKTTIQCPAGKKIKFNALGCSIEIGPQTPTGGHVIFSNVLESGRKQVTLAATLTGLHYNHSGFLCGTASATNGTFTGNMVMRAFDGENQVNTWIT